MIFSMYTCNNPQHIPKIQKRIRPHKKSVCVTATSHCVYKCLHNLQLTIWTSHNEHRPMDALYNISCNRRMFHNLQRYNRTQILSVHQCAVNAHLGGINYSWPLKCNHIRTAMGPQSQVAWMSREFESSLEVSTRNCLHTLWNHFTEWLCLYATCFGPHAESSYTHMYNYSQHEGRNMLRIHTVTQ